MYAKYVYSHVDVGDAFAYKLQNYFMKRKSSYVGSNEYLIKINALIILLFISFNCIFIVRSDRTMYNKYLIYILHEKDDPFLLYFLFEPFLWIYKFFY